MSILELIQEKKIAIKMLEEEEFKLIVRKLSINRRINEETNAEAQIAAKIRVEKLKLSELIISCKLWRFLRKSQTKILK